MVIGKCGYIFNAENVYYNSFNDMESKDIVSINSMINAYKKILNNLLKLHLLMH